jgi:hypothetical protein
MINQNNEQFKPSPVFNETAEIKRRKEFSHREVGLTHPDNKAFIRITDMGEIEIFGAPGVGLVINPNTRSISIFADSIKMYCKDDDGLRWNEKSFNPAADVYNEPALLKTGDFLNNPAYYRTGQFLNNLESYEQEEVVTPITIIGKYGLGLNNEQGSEVVEDPNGFTFEQVSLIEAYSKTHTESEVAKLQQFIKMGYSYQDAVSKVETSDFNEPSDMENFPWLDNDLDK